MSRPRSRWLVATASAAVLVVLLCVRNRFLFTTRLYEDADMGANSILVEQARHFTLLVGNYSRDHFHHPGPAYMYVMAAGESLFWAGLHVVPTAWNGQLLAVYALNGMFMALVVAVGYGWTWSMRGAAACFAAVLALASVHPAVLSSDWMPYMYVPAYIAFLVAAASVAAGGVRDAWMLALTGWFLIHGHAGFLLFVPVIGCAAGVAVLWPRRHRLGTSVRSFLTTQWRTWVPVVVISAVFALPIVANLVLHWPGQFGDYLTYASSRRAGGHSVAQAVRDALWYWSPYRDAWVIPVAGYAVAVAVTRWLAPVRLRRFLIALLAVNAVSSLAFLYYAATGIDALSRHYVGYFYWSAPVITLLVITVGVVEAMPLARWAPSRPPARRCSRWPPSRWHRKRTPARTAAIRPCSVAARTRTRHCPVPSPRSPRARMAGRSCCGSTSLPGRTSPASSCRRSGQGYRRVSPTRRGLS